MFEHIEQDPITKDMPFANDDVTWVRSYVPEIILDIPFPSRESTMDDSEADVKDEDIEGWDLDDQMFFM